MDEKYIAHNHQLMLTWCENFNQEGACPVVAIGLKYIDGGLHLVAVENYDLKVVLQIMEDAARYLRQMMQ